MCSLWHRLGVGGKICLAVIAAYFALAVFGEVQFRVAKARDVTPGYNVVRENCRYLPPLARAPAAPDAPCGRLFLLGTDNLGRDVAARLVQGARIAFHVGTLTALIAIPLGVLLGLLGGYFGGKTDSLNEAVGRFIESTEKQIGISLANSVWFNKTAGLTVNKNFTRKVTDTFGA